MFCFVFYCLEWHQGQKHKCRLVRRSKPLNQQKYRHQAVRKHPAKSPAQSPGPSPGRATRNSNKPTYVGSTEATTEMASKKRKTDQSATDCVGSSSSSTGRVRNKVNRLGDFAQHLDVSDGEEKDDENEEKDDEDDDDDEADDAQEVEVRSQPLTPSRSLEMPIIQLLKKGRQIKSVSPIGDPYPDPNFP